MQVKIEKWGNNAAIKIPDEILNEIEASIGDVVEVNFELIEAKKPKYKLADLIAECNGELGVLEEWENMPSVGLEKT